MKRILIIIGFLLSLSLNTFATESMVYGPMPTAKDTPANGETFTWDETSGIGEWESFPAVATTPTKAADNTATDTLLCTADATTDAIKQCDNAKADKLTISDLTKINGANHETMFGTIVSNGNFWHATDWTLPPGWTYGAYKIEKTAGNTNAAEQTIPIIAGETYVVIFNTAPTAGGITVSLGGTAGTQRTTEGFFGERIIAGSSNSKIVFTPTSDFAGVVKNVRVYNANTRGLVIVGAAADSGTSYGGMGEVEIYNSRVDGHTSSSNNSLYLENDILQTSGTYTTATNLYTQLPFRPALGTLSYTGSIEDATHSISFASQGTAHTIPNVIVVNAAIVEGALNSATYTITSMDVMRSKTIKSGSATGLFNISGMLTGHHIYNLDLDGTIAGQAGLLIDKQVGGSGTTNKYGIALDGDITASSATDLGSALVMGDGQDSSMGDDGTYLILDADVQAAGNRGVKVLGSASSTIPVLDVWGQTILWGADANAATRTTATPKSLYLDLPHYDNTEENIRVLFGTSANGVTTFNFGGGANRNQPTAFNFYTATSSISTTPNKVLGGDANRNIHFTDAGTMGANSAGTLMFGNNTTAPTTAPVNGYQFWAADNAAGDTRMYIMSEKSTQTVVIGDGKVAQSTGSETCGSGEGADLCTDPLSRTVYITSTAATTDVMAIADGARAGEERLFILVVDGGADVDITPTNILTGTKVTFDAIMDSVLLHWTGTKWAVVGGNGYTAS